MAAKNPGLDGPTAGTEGRHGPRSPAAGEVRIGISGWTYPPWRGVFFPPGLVQREELAYASRQVGSIEVNGTFYGLQKPASYARWYEETPDDFVFALKAPRFVTHVRRLKGGPGPIANFFASGVLRLADKLGPILWQLPPSLRYDRATLADFLALLPRDTVEAAQLARSHEATVGDTWIETDRRRTLRHALEIRHPSFANADFIALLREFGVALVVADTAGKWPLLEDVTADFVYVRLHGDVELYVSGYTPAALDRWAEKVRAWANGRVPARSHLVTARAEQAETGGRDVFVYFDNDVKIRAPYDAMSLAHRLGLGPEPPPAPDAATISEQPRTHWPAYGQRQRRGASSSRPSSPSDESGGPPRPRSPE